MASLEILQSLSLADTLSHAWLLVSADSAGLLQVAKEFSQWLLCANKDGNVACAKCRECNLFLAGTNPDFYLVTPHADKTSILVEDVRAITDFVITKPQFGAKKVVLLYPAEGMHKQSANALLKSLEEPCTDTIFLLLTKNPNLLLKTIVSRCQVLYLNDALADTGSTSVNKQDIITQMYRDLDAMWVKRSMTSVQIVDAWLKHWPDDVLYCLELIVTDMLMLNYTQTASLSRTFCADLLELTAKVLPNKLWAILNKLRQVQSWLGTNNKPNMQLALEDILATR